MARYTPVALSQAGRGQPIPEIPPAQEQTVTPLMAGVLVGQAVRDEHGREGVRSYVCALNPLLPRALVEQIASKLGVDTPPPLPPSTATAAPVETKPTQKEAPAIPPELMLQLLQGMGGGGGGLDPSMLLKLLQNK